MKGGQASPLQSCPPTPDDNVKSSPEYISFLLVSLCHTYNQAMHILQKFVPLKSEKKKNTERERLRLGNNDLLFSTSI